MATEDNGNGVGFFGKQPSPINSTNNSGSNEDLSEYTDADESISAPTEFLAEFLSAVMLKDYVTALKYCKLILQYEPNNVTAKEFYPLILEKLQQTNNMSGDDEEDGGENGTSGGSSASSDDGSGSGTSNTSEDEDDEEEDEEDEDEEVKNGGGDKRSSGGDGDATTGSYSSLEDDEPEMDQLAALAAKCRFIDNADLENGNRIFSAADDNMATGSNNFNNKTFADDDNNKNTTTLPLVGMTMASSDSESPTDPTVSQETQVQMAAILRSRVVPLNNK